MAKLVYAGSWDDKSKTWALVETTEGRVVESGLTKTEACNKAFSLNMVEQPNVQDS